METNASSLPFRDLLTTTKDGDWGRDSPDSGFVPFRVIRGTDFPSVRFGDLERVPLRYLNESTAHRRTLEEDDILLETAGGSPGRPTGRSLLITQKVLSGLNLPATCASFARFLRVDREKAEPQYVFWYLQHLYANGEMEEHQVQHTGVARFQYTRFASSICVPLPARETQRAIAHILGTLDDKIELNRRSNETLEAMARALFKDWFVDFGPVRAKREGREPYLAPELWSLFPDRFDSSGIPSGWEHGTLDDLLILQRGFDLPTSNRSAGSHPVISASGLHGTHTQAMAEAPGVVTGRSGVLGKVFLMHEDFWPLNTTLWVKEFKRATPHYAFELLQTMDLASFNAGSAVPTLNRNHIHGLPQALPSPNCVTAFETFASGCYRAVRCNDKESETLATLRDTLLPKLLSGELHVRDVEREVETAL